MYGRGFLVEKGKGFFFNAHNFKDVDINNETINTCWNLVYGKVS